MRLARLDVKNMPSKTDRPTLLRQRKESQEDGKEKENRKYGEGGIRTCADRPLQRVEHGSSGVGRLSHPLDRVQHTPENRTTKHLEAKDKCNIRRAVSTFRGLSNDVPARHARMTQGSPFDKCAFAAWSCSVCCKRN